MYSSDSDVIDRAADLIEKGWTRKYYATDIKNTPVDIQDPTAVNFCLLGAILWAYTHDGRSVPYPIHNMLLKNLKGLNPTYYNDIVATNKRDVVRKLKKLSKELKKQYR